MSAPPRVYIETSIPSFYVTTRNDDESRVMRKWTRRWWDNHRHEYEIVTSEAVKDELSDGSYPTKTEAVKFIENIPILPAVPAIRTIVSAYFRRHLMPKDPPGDALHLALASFYQCDFLLTWNCRHLANANKFRHIETVNRALGLFVPTLVTPMNLVEARDER